MFPVEFFIGLILIGVAAGFASGLLGVGGGSIIFFCVRKIITFKDCMDSLPEGFRAMVPRVSLHVALRRLSFVRLSEAY